MVRSLAFRPWQKLACVVALALTAFTLCLSTLEAMQAPRRLSPVGLSSEPSPKSSPSYSASTSASTQASTINTTVDTVALPCGHLAALSVETLPRLACLHNEHITLAALLETHVTSPALVMAAVNQIIEKFNRTDQEAATADEFIFYAHVINTPTMAKHLASTHRADFICAIWNLLSAHKVNRPAYTRHPAIILAIKSLADNEEFDLDIRSDALVILQALNAPSGFGGIKTLMNDSLLGLAAAARLAFQESGELFDAFRPAIGRLIKSLVFSDRREDRKETMAEGLSLLQRAALLDEKFVFCPEITNALVAIIVRNDWGAAIQEAAIKTLALRPVGRLTPQLRTILNDLLNARPTAECAGNILMLLAVDIFSISQTEKHDTLSNLSHAIEVADFLLATPGIEHETYLNALLFKHTHNACLGPSDNQAFSPEHLEKITQLLQAGVADPIAARSWLEKISKVLATFLCLRTSAQLSEARFIELEKLILSNDLSLSCKCALAHIFSLIRDRTPQRILKTATLARLHTLLATEDSHVLAEHILNLLPYYATNVPPFTLNELEPLFLSANSQQELAHTTCSLLTHSQSLVQKNLQQAIKFRPETTHKLLQIIDNVQLSTALRCNATRVFLFSSLLGQHPLLPPLAVRCLEAIITSIPHTSAINIYLSALIRSYRLQPITLQPATLSWLMRAVITGQPNLLLVNILFLLALYAKRNPDFFFPSNLIAQLQHFITSEGPVECAVRFNAIVLLALHALHGSLFHPPAALINAAHRRKQEFLGLNFDQESWEAINVFFNKFPVSTDGTSTLDGTANVEEYFA